MVRAGTVTYLKELEDYCDWLEMQSEWNAQQAEIDRLRALLGEAALSLRINLGTLRAFGLRGDTLGAADALLAKLAQEGEG